jgi:DNA-binding CsgD family transcriptional regulator
LSANIASTLMEEIASPGETIANGASLLTKREEEVVRLLAEGLSSREIAERLHLGIRTVDTHRAHIMEKIGVHSTVELVTYAIRQGIVRA